MEINALEYCQESSGSATTDITPPTFGGVQTFAQQPNGSFLVGYLAASDDNPDIDYYYYILPLPATDVELAAAPVAFITKNLSGNPFRDSNGDLFQEDVEYRILVRAVAGGLIDNNLVTLTAVSRGVLSDHLTDVSEDLLNAIARIEVIATSCELEGEIEPDDEISGEIEC